MIHHKSEWPRTLEAPDVSRWSSEVSPFPFSNGLDTRNVYRAFYLAFVPQAADPDLPTLFDLWQSASYRPCRGAAREAPDTKEALSQARTKRGSRKLVDTAREHLEAIPRSAPQSSELLTGRARKHRKTRRFGSLPGVSTASSAVARWMDSRNGREEMDRRAVGYSSQRSHRGKQCWYWPGRRRAPVSSAAIRKASSLATPGRRVRRSRDLLLGAERFSGEQR